MTTEIASAICVAFGLILVIVGVGVILRERNIRRGSWGSTTVAEQRFRRYATAERVQRETDTGPWRKPE